MIDQVQTTRLANGLTILTEHMPGLRSVSLGIWVRRGSRHETPALNGICHFIEHALFKGTTRRSAHQIAEESDRLGGHLDAYTAHEMTGFALKVVDSEVHRAFDLLADLLSNPRFEPGDLVKEQKVIIEEMKMIEDTPDELLTELFHAAYFPDHSLGRPIEGTVMTVSSFDKAKTVDFHAENFAPRNLVVAAAGNVDHHQLTDLVEKMFGDRQNASLIGSPARLWSRRPSSLNANRNWNRHTSIVAAPWPSAKSKDRYAASMLGTIIGCGTPAGYGNRFAKSAGWLIPSAPVATPIAMSECSPFMPELHLHNLMRSWICHSLSCAGRYANRYRKLNYNWLASRRSRRYC